MIAFPRFSAAGKEPHPFDFDSLAELQAAFDSTAATVYPALPDTTRVFSAQELQDGVFIDTSCSGALTEGPLPDETGEIRARLEIPANGVYDATYAPIPPIQFLSVLRPPSPYYGDSFPVRPTPCADGSLLFPSAGQYEFSISQPLDLSFTTTVSLTSLQRTSCAW